MDDAKGENEKFRASADICSITTDPNIQLWTNVIATHMLLQLIIAIVM